MRWGVEKRLEFIEFRVFWEGGLNRADLMERFGVSVPQASKDLSLYEEKAPGNLVYDKRRKRYFAAPGFKPVFLAPDADAYLSQLRAVSAGAAPPDGTWLSSMPDIGIMPVPHRRIEVAVLRSLVQAVRTQRAIQILYVSMNPSRPEPAWRWITPHAFATDGMRWHVRAYCHIDNKFKDFLLSRCLETRGDEPPGAGPVNDFLWHEVFSVVLCPNPALAKSLKAVIERDYEMTGGQVVVPIRKALLYYFQKRLRFDAASALDAPQETPVVIANRAEFDAALAEAAA